MEFSYLFSALKRRKWVIVICVAVAVVAAFLFTLKAKKEYKSMAQFSTGFTLGEEMKLSKEVFNVPEIDIKFNNVIENITSPKVISLLSYRLMLHDLQTGKPFTILEEKDKQKPEYQKVNKQKAIATLNSALNSMQLLSTTNADEKALLDYLELYKYDIESVRKQVQVTRYQRTDYINIIYTSHNPDLSAYSANTLFTEFIDYYGNTKKNRADGSITNLDSLVKQKKTLLDQRILEKTKFMSSQNVLDVGIEGSNKLSQISSFETSLIEEKSNQQNLSYRVKQLDNLIENARSNGLTSVVAPKTTSNAGDNDDYISLRRQLNDLSSQYIQGGSSDPELKKKIDNVKLNLAKVKVTESTSGDAVVGDNGGKISLDQLIQKKIEAEGQLRASTQKVASMQTKLNELYGGLNGMAAKGANIEQLDKEIQLASSEYTAAKEQYSLAQNLNEAVPVNFKQTLLGEPAIKPEPSKRLITIALAGSCALLLSSLVLIFTEYIDRSIKTPTQFNRLTHLNLLGSVNWVKFQDGILETVSLTDVKEGNRENTFRELLRKIRYELENSNKKIFLFTSTEPRQGKTTLIQAIAYSLSLSKKKVLIIDTNFCNNDITVAINANPVLEKFYVNGKPFEINDAKKLITKTSAEGVDVIGCQGGDYTPAEILPKNHLLNYLGQLKEEYDFIFLEGAPLNDYTDTKELLRFADSIVAVFSAEKILSEADRESIRFLQANKEKFLGVILNKVQEENLDL